MGLFTRKKSFSGGSRDVTKSTMGLRNAFQEQNLPQIEEEDDGGHKNDDLLQVTQMQAAEIEQLKREIQRMRSTLPIADREESQVQGSLPFRGDLQAKEEEVKQLKTALREQETRLHNCIEDGKDKPRAAHIDFEKRLAESNAGSVEALENMKVYADQQKQNHIAQIAQVRRQLSEEHTKAMRLERTHETIEAELAEKKEELRAHIANFEQRNTKLKNLLQQTEERHAKQARSHSSIIAQTISALEKEKEVTALANQKTEQVEARFARRYEEQEKAHSAAIDKILGDNAIAVQAQINAGGIVESQLKTATEEIVNKEHKISNLEAHLVSLDKERKVAKSKAQQIQEQRDAQAKEQSAGTEKIASLESRLSLLNQELKRAILERTQVQAQRDAQGKEQIAKIKKINSKLEKSKRELVNERSKCKELQEKFNQLKTERHGLERHLNEHTQELALARSELQLVLRARDDERAITERFRARIVHMETEHEELKTKMELEAKDERSRMQDVEATLAQRIHDQGEEIQDTRLKLNRANAELNGVKRRATQAEEACKIKTSQLEFVQQKWVKLKDNQQGRPGRHE